MTNYWYVARANELFIDTDNVERSIAHTKSRLQGAIECGKLDVSHIMQRKSRSGNHCHTIITLKQEMPDVQRFAWEVILHGDIYRACCNLMRWSANVEAPDILISPFAIFFSTSTAVPSIPFIRNHDTQCNCKDKHAAAVMENCPAAKRLRGNNRAMTFFGKPSKNPCIPWPK